MPGEWPRSATRVAVPVRYPSSEHSRTMLEEVVRVPHERDVELTVLHVDLYQSNHSVIRAELKRAAEAEFGSLVRARYVVRRGFLVEEMILEEVAAEEVDIVVIESKQASRRRRMLRRFLDDLDIDMFLREKLDCTVITVRADD